MMIILIFSTDSNAITVGGQILPIGANRWQVGSEVVWFKRDLQNQNNRNDRWTLDNGLAALGKVTYGINDKADVYLRLGTTRMDNLMNDQDGVDTTSYRYQSNFNLTWGLGLKAELYDFGNGLKLGGDAQYQSTPGFSALNSSNNGSSFKIDNFYEWHIGMHIYQTFEIFTPYIGVKWSDLRIDRQGAGGDLESKDVVSLYVGTDIAIAGAWKGFAEGRFVDETAFSVGANYTF